KALSFYGYTNIIFASDGAEALKIIKDNIGSIALYVFDVNMPVMDGLTLVKETRQIDTTTPIIMLTTETDKKKMLIARDNGATGWVIKPFEAEKFIKVIEMYLK
ncbi:MAG TPA: response regulator, partial [Exilispira sp.]|nr:response regulator [Exilispira sp.]